MRRALGRIPFRVERRWDAGRLRRRDDLPPEHFRIVTYLGHGSAGVLQVRGRVLDNPEPSEAVEGEGPWAATRRTVRRFLTDELPGVPLRIRVAGTEVEAVSDDEGYLDLRVETAAAELESPWATGEVELASSYRGVIGTHTASLQIRVPGPGVAFGVVSDIDDTILLTGAQRALGMIRQTLTGSALTRLPFAGAPELYRALVANGSPADENPIFYVSSSPWNLYDFLIRFLSHRDFPRGPLMLRDLLGSGTTRSHALHKNARIDEILGLHPTLRFVLIGDSGQHDPEIYADVVRRHPGRIVAVYIREVRLDTGDRRVEAVTDGWDDEVPFVLAPDSVAVADHAAGLGLITAEQATQVRVATWSGT